MCLSLSVCVVVHAGLENNFTVNREIGRKSDYQLIMIQPSDEVGIGVYDSNRSHVVLYEMVQYKWPDNTSNVPKALPVCYQQTCLFISTYT